MGNIKIKQLNQVWLWIKTNVFYIISVLVGVLGFVIAGVSLSQTSRRYAEQATELEKMRSIQAAEILRHQQIEAQTQAIIRRIEKEKEQEIGRLTQRQRDNIQLIVEETGENPELMRDRIASILGTPLS